MSSFNGSPKPLNRPTLNEGIFKFEEGPVVVKGLNPIQVQRKADGSPYTRSGVSAIGPAQPKLTLRDSDIVSKSKNCASPSAEVDRERSEDTAADPENKIAKAKESLSSYLMRKGVKLPIEF